MPVELRVGDLVREKGMLFCDPIHGEIMEIVEPSVFGHPQLYCVKRDDEDHSITTFHIDQLECFQFAPVEMEKERDDPNLVVKLAVHTNMDESDFLRTIEMLRVSVLKEALEIVKEADPSAMVTDRLVHHIEGILREVEK